jgi:hypothetical protein
MLCPAEGSAAMTAGCVFEAASMDAPESPPRSEITGTPVRPWNSSPARVSVRTGVVIATATVAVTSRGLSGLSSSPVTSPTRMPLKSTAAPVSSPDTLFSKRTRYTARSPSPPALLSQYTKPNKAPMAARTNSPIST